MQFKKLYTQIKNRKLVEITYWKNPDTDYTVRLEFKDGRFKIYSFFFVGNDVFDDGNYKDESMITCDNFSDLIIILQAKFPGIELEVKSVKDLEKEITEAMNHHNT